jgi:predicted permease
MVRSFVTLYQTERVIDTEDLVTARLALPSQRYALPEARRRFFESLDARLSTAQVLSGFAIATDIPFTRVNSSRRLALEGQTDASADVLPTVSHVYADSRYFQTLGLRLIGGRWLGPDDGRPGREAVLVNNRLAEMFFPAGDAIGRRIRLLTNPGVPDEPAPWRSIVGIVPDIPQVVGNGDLSRPTVFVPLNGETTPSVVSLFARTKIDMAATVALIRDEVRALDPDLPLYYVQTMEDVFADARVPSRVIGTWFSTLALIALVLATVGLYAITGHSVTQRTQEIGVRVALGAATTDVVWMFLRRTVLQVGIGMMIGLAGAQALARLLRSTPLFGASSSLDPLTLTLVTILLVVAALVATLLPARHAARIDPLAALRYE